MKHTVEFELKSCISSDVLNCNYYIGKVDEKHFIYIWAANMGEEVEVTYEMINHPKYDHGAMIGTVQEITKHIAECVGGFREHGDDDQKKAAEEVVEELYSAFE